MAYTENEARALVIEAGHRLLENKLIARTWGNISARISDTQFIITPSGRAYDTLKPSELVKVNISDLKYDGDIKPSSEKGIHASVYALRPNVNFVIHTHQFYASAVCAEEKDTDFAPCAAYGLPGTKKLKMNVSESIKLNPDSRAFLMAKHGALCLGSDFDESFSVASELEEKSRMLFESRVKISDGVCEAIDEEYFKKYFPYVIHNKDRFTLECSMKFRSVPAYIDDYAQIVGPNARCSLPPNRLVCFALKDRNAALIQKQGGICVGGTQDDVEAVSMILSKNCAAALYVENTKPLGAIDSRIQRVVYLKKYSRQK